MSDSQTKMTKNSHSSHFSDRLFPLNSWSPSLAHTSYWYFPHSEFDISKVWHEWQRESDQSREKGVWEQNSFPTHYSFFFPLSNAHFHTFSFSLTRIMQLKERWRREELVCHHADSSSSSLSNFFLSCHPFSLSSLFFCSSILFIISPSNFQIEKSISLHLRSLSELFAN